MQGAGAGDAARKNLAALRDELLEHLHVFVVDVLELLDAELADALAAVEELLLATLRAARAALTGTTAARRTTFAARTTWSRSHVLSFSFLLLGRRHFGRHFRRNGDGGGGSRSRSGRGGRPLRAEAFLLRGWLGALL